MIDISKWAFENKKLIYFLIAVLIVGGAYSSYEMSKLIDFDVRFVGMDDLLAPNQGDQLIGTGFDRNYEGLTGDIAFRPSSQRAACVDIRYTLFIIEKYAGASHIIKEMDISD